MNKLAMLSLGILISLALATFGKFPANAEPISQTLGQTLSSPSGSVLASNPEEVPFKPPYEVVSAGVQHACGIMSNGQATCWGDDSFGQATPPAGEFMQISAGAYHTCALQATGVIQCWGLNDDGQTNVPAGSFSAVSAGSYHTCAIQSNGQVVCWGRNTDGQSTPVAGSFLQVSAGARHTCGVQNSGEVVCWGDDSQGESGAPTATFRMVSAGTDFSCGVQDSGMLLCWGLDTDGQASPPAGYFKDVSAGDTHACAVQGNGDMVCWGADTQGQVTGFPAGGKFKQVTSGTDFSCGFLGNGMAACWGADAFNQDQPPFGIVFGLPQVSTSNSSLGSPIFGEAICGVKSTGNLICWDAYYYGGDYFRTIPGTYLQISIGSSGDSIITNGCAIRTDGSSFCWSEYDIGIYEFPPALQPPSEDIFIQISANKSFGCGLRQNGTLVCWGDNTYDQALPPTGLFKMVSSGERHACALDYSGHAVCWGDNTYGQASSPASALFSEISAGRYYTCGLLNTGELVCWGSSGYGLTNPPVVQFRQVSSGYNHAYAVGSDGIPECWGYSGVSDGIDETGGICPSNFSGYPLPNLPVAYISTGHLVTCLVYPNGRVACGGQWLCEGVYGEHGFCSTYYDVRSAPSFDVQPPFVNVEQAAQQADPSNNPQLYFDAVFSEPVSGFTSQDVSLSGSAGATTVTVTGSGANYKLAVSGMTASGSVIVSINAGVASDGSGNANYASTSVDNQVTFDAESPNTIITVSPSLFSNNPSPAFEFSSPNPNATFECQLDGEPFSACESPKTYSLNDGEHTFEVRAKDGDLLDPDPAIYTWTVDTVPPETNLLSHPDDPSNDLTPTFEFNSNETATFECQRNTEPFALCTSPKSYSWSDNGLNTFQVRAKDAAGNYDPSPALFTWNVDTKQPYILSIMRADPDPTSKPRVDFTITFSENVKNVDVSDFAPIMSKGLTGATIHSVSGTGTIYTVTVNTGTGNGTLELTLPDKSGITDIAGNTLIKVYTIEAYTVQKMLTSQSTGAQDGWTLESGENTNMGGTMNSTSTTLLIGDDSLRKQYRSILSFDTSSLPDNAVVTKVTLKIRRQSVVGGGHPITDFQGFMTDVRRGTFGVPALELADWQTRAHKTLGPLTVTASGQWYILDLSGAKAYINKLASSSGLTQIRLRFKLDDDGNHFANYLSLYSGDAGATSRPQLIAEYYVP